MTPFWRESDVDQTPGEPCQNVILRRFLPKDLVLRSFVPLRITLDLSRAENRGLGQHGFAVVAD